MQIYYAFEDSVSEAVAIKLIKQEKIGCELKKLGTRGGGRSPILAHINKYNQMSKISPVILFIDLDKDECAPSLMVNYPIRDKQPPNKLQVRIAVREVESWLLADKQGIEIYFGIPQNAIPHNPEELDDPKQELLNLIKGKSNADFKREMLPNGKVISGSEYNNYLTDFINTAWDSTRACANADSLDRAIKGIQQITP